MTRFIAGRPIMYDIKWIRENADLFDDGRRRRGLEPLSAQLLALDDARRTAIGELQTAQERRNAASKEIGAAMKAGDAARAEALKAEVAEIKENWPALEEAERYAIAELDAALSSIPNTPLDSVPDGKDEHDNVEVAALGRPRAISTSRRKSISTLARVSALWISRSRQNFRARASS